MGALDTDVNEAPTNVIQIDANRYESAPIVSVTVYVADRATVTRRIPVELKAGKNEVTVNKLPTILEPESIRVETESTIRDQDLVVFDVYHSNAASRSKKHDGDTLLLALRDRQATLKAKLTALNKQSEVLQKFGAGLSGSDTRPEDLGKFLDMQFRVEEKLFTDVQSTNKELSAVQKDIDKATRASQSAHEEKKAIGVTAIILAGTEGPAEVILTYMVSSASWKALYDVRADIEASLGQSKSVDAFNTKVILEYRASIVQSTGEDWKGVALTLSTASPNVGSDIPELSPWNIGQPHTLRTRSVTKSRGLSLRASSGIVADSFSAPKYKAKIQMATVTEGAISSSYEIAGFSNIPSDESEHKVSVTAVNLDAKLTWITAPRSVPSVFLQCRIKNTSNFLLVAGQSSVFMDGNFVAKSSIPDVSPAEYFNCSLGVDPAVRITYHPRRQLTSHQESGFLSKAKIEATTFSQRISVKNTRPGPLECLVVRDQIPLSADERIKVKIINPNEEALGPFNGIASTSKSLAPESVPRVASISPNVTARWAQKDTEDDILGEGKGPKGDGVLEWICLNAKDNLDLELVYEVSNPSGLKWE
ncbi:uncharacterized protein EI90DRAFT_3031797 [Cantharellus anzutake]|uniref:uncharacterized protein n=1 Tax=Cantharellus anzutake TaxID=1750568 RepID=UPI001905DE70|nr:uncharacterized protein EI90DRAFT_3031797 [Cantharellus anzutake]KAF8341996.1 hypothetical protein EI90DRAFT_3031797 [Cantharellus anzutake]